MSDKKATTKRNRATTEPVALLIAKEIEETKANGEYCVKTDTWSNRNYELASSKKHCEDM